MLIRVNIPTFVQSNSPLVGDFCLYKMERTQIFTKIEEIVQSFGFMLVESNIRGDNHLKIIEVFIDGKVSVTSEDCSNVSRAINEAIGTQNLIETNYRLDVSSPGVDRPLKFLEQFPKHINRKFELIYREGEEEKKIIAKLISVENENLFFEQQGTKKEERKSEYKISFGDIVKAKVLISF